MDQRRAVLLELQALDHQLAGGVQRVQASREPDRPARGPAELREVWGGVPRHPGGGQEERVEADEAVGEQRELHLAAVRRGPAQGARAGGTRALPLGVRRVHPDHAVADAAATEEAVDFPLANPASRQRDLELAFRRAKRVDAAGHLELARERGAEVPAGERGQVEPREPEREVLRRPTWAAAWS